MSFIKTEFDTLLRDTSSKAIIVADNKAREEFKKKAQEKQKLETVFSELQNLKEYINEIDNLRNDITEIKQLILSISNNKAQ